MAGGNHYKKVKGKKPYLKKWEWIVVICVCAAMVLGTAGYFIVRAILDDSLSVKGGKVVTDGDNWIIANEGTGDKPKYYKYAEYDFSSMDAKVEVEPVNTDENVNGVYVYPNNGEYTYAYIYSNKFDYAELSESVHSQMGAILENGDVREINTIDYNGTQGAMYWYTNWSTETDEDGIPLQNEDGSEKTTYTQSFSCYMPMSRGGCVIVRVAHKGTSESIYVDYETGRAEIIAVLDCLTIE